MIEHFMQLDYALLNLSLDIEVNADMAPDRMRKVIDARLQQMSDRERRALPVPIWECLEAIMPPGVMQKFNPNKPPAGQENRGHWFSVSKDAGSSIAMITPKKQAPAEFLRALRTKDRYKTWERVHHVKARASSTVVTLEALILEDLPASYFKTVFESF